MEKAANKHRNFFFNDGFMPFWRAFVWSKMQISLSRIWTLLIWSVFCDTNYSAILAPVGCEYRIHWLHLCRGVRHHPPQRVFWYVTKQSYGEATVMLELWRMKNTPSLLSLPCPLWFGMVAPDWVLSMDKIELNCLLMLNWIVWNRTGNMYKSGPTIVDML